MASEHDMLATVYPEVRAGGYTRSDGSVEFYGRVTALVKPGMRVLDFGAGRAEWFEDDECGFRKALRQLRGKVREVVACDVDPAVHQNRAADRVVQIDPQKPLPFADAYFDVVIADYVFEHLDQPRHVTQELTRVLASGGWICARTPNRYGYVALGSGLVGNRAHLALLARLQPQRKAIDVFPTRYRLNTLGSIRRHFPRAHFDDFTYRYDPEPAYFFGRRWILISLRFLQALLPPPFASQLFIFLRKRT